MKHVRFVALLLVVIGALDLGSIGFFEVDFLGHILGGAKHTLARFVFGLIGVAGLYSATLLFGCGCGCCGCNCSRKK